MSDLLRVSGACVEFRSHGSSVKALDGVSFSIGRGECLAVVGESGSGKTTLARSILGLQKLDRGTIDWLGGETNGLLAERIGMVWQDPYASLDPRWKVGRSISEPCEIARKACNLPELMRQVGLDPAFADRYPHQMSGGQRQRVAIARAILKDPRILLLDEATSSLDSESERLVAEALDNLMRNRTTVIIAHRLSTVQRADRIAVLDSGHLVELGTHADLLALDGLYARLYRMQFAEA